MKRIIIYTITAVVCIGMNTFGVQHFKKNQKQTVNINKEALQVETIKIVAASTLATVKTETAKLASAGNATLKEQAIKAGSAKLVWSSNTHLKAKAVEAKPSRKALATTKLAAKPKDLAPKKVTIKNITLKKVSFEQLPGWNKSGVKNSLAAFQESCKVFLKKKPTHPVGSQLIKLKAKDWLPACNEAVSIDATTEASAKTFFQKWFYPLELIKRKPIHGIFTGYYMPLVKGNLTKTKQYNIPIYGLPKQLPWNGQRTHSYARQAIDKGALNKQAPVIAWIHSPVERLFLEIEGSGVIRLASGKKLYLGYAGENGAHYTPVASVLIKNGVMNKDTASKTAIKRYFQNHPSKVNTILHQNKSFVFFENLKKPIALGVQDITLTPGYSLAIDKRWIPLGSPLWLSTKKPLSQNNRLKDFQRLMIAQDTGGAIRGLMRGDVYWGSGKQASFLGENMKNEGRYWLFLPKHIFDKLTSLGRMVG
ncbi:membrane-bound lytic murein transglycosylase (MltA) family protein [Legionella nautarum]|uniref:peptidoglycan lytic exotransglycosylase n=2 Tax=Legionella nautarum TaxID=45070 RepID=A0A0W0X2N0_9GAMM|nr:membrane-bound lytic murein transglycosylase (MltA) family protein [Legionella nautarum]